MATIKRMDQIKDILQNYLLSGKVKVTCRQLNVSRNTVREYIRRAESYCSDLSKVLSLDDEVFYQVMSASQAKNVDQRLAVFEGLVDYWLKELRRVGVTRELLWEEYRREHPEGYGYSQYCEHLSRHVMQRDLTLALEHRPGEVLMLDFAGKKMEWVDIHTGELHACEMLIAVLPFSQYSFCIALPSQRLPDFIEGINQSLVFLGALPQVFLSDNLKAYVSKADRYEPTFTQLCEQLGAHYQIDLSATRVASPKDKASVESTVMQVYRRVYAPLRQQVFHSIEEINIAIKAQLLVHNTLPYQKKEGTRQSMFDTYELPRMRPLPSDLFEIKKITGAKVQRNYHVFLGESKEFYSVPWQYAGQHAEVLYTSRIVEIYVHKKRVATHQRLSPYSQKYGYQTREEHMPKHHQEWKKAQGYDAAYFLEQGQLIGPATQWAMQQVLLSRIHEPQAYNSCKGILQLAKKNTPERLEKAATRCQFGGKVTYNMLKRILHLHLDELEEQQPVQLSLGFHDNIRGPEYYQ